MLFNKLHFYLFFPWPGILPAARSFLQLYLISTLLLTACSPHTVNENRTVLVNSPAVYSLPATAIKDGDKTDFWWEEFDDPVLDRLISTTLANNFTLRQARERINQARAVEKQAAAQLFPEATGHISGTSTWTNDGEQQERYLAQVELTWEADLWERLSSRSKAAILESQVSLDDLEAIALALSAQVAEVYFQIIEQQLQLALLERQIETGEKFFALTKLRFANGAA